MKTSICQIKFINGNKLEFNLYDRKIRPFEIWFYSREQNKTFSMIDFEDFEEARNNFENIIKENHDGKEYKLYYNY